MLLNNRDLGIRAAPQNEKRRIRRSGFFFFFSQVGTNLQILLEDRSLKRNRGIFLFFGFFFYLFRKFVGSKFPEVKV
ncbi:hypothetical protein EGK28_15265 [Enterococcus faecium]|nr:hypothetical protein B1P94_05350 [Enterococcus faecium]RSA55268.1 hypothetical protein EGK28_15265 [Enterococcus faecium]RSA63510.1 hypothetical protein EGK42_15100 [Enterococcus faecium]